MSRHLTVTISLICFSACGGGGGAAPRANDGTAATIAVADRTPPRVPPTPEEIGIPESERENVSGMTPPGVLSPASDPGGVARVGAAPDDTAALTEAHVFAILGAASDQEIAISRQALGKSKNKRVRKLAQTMASDHGRMKKESQDLATRMSIAPASSADVVTLEKEGAAALETLRGLSGTAFDQAFASQLVKDHEKMLSLLETRLKPAAQANTDLQTLLEKDRPRVERHLVEARSLLARLEAGG